ncbi:MAG: hypothetical protein A2977_02915 [Alphaproteobacteria bacterium RIFCSPLOWO2_01_FULL_45_8]|nr:MAG: hypothetical protein A2065_00190 [Alphaproteobacteria bacterium GWB1_45_5]OFW76100.1 MAG: hypothetical protein A3K20_03140 [Alphaproteobacteria bacterium GWA1_45_9]OFW90241.1 MAG: hypothetical protein A2621_04600 [Alphaproteobacteria bacterium RIFCSPHIGHO2_01_FULL_41_14]OFW96189.1 MAG: hypothetical protein A2977_02915 [Alphaproteobacteria bacterium RIFCSPLOWO2_01_FULL_45_8]HCI48778.1 hypothetical protein [Holosporales bacterium]
MIIKNGSADIYFLYNCRLFSSEFVKTLLTILTSAQQKYAPLLDIFFLPKIRSLVLQETLRLFR